MNNKGFTLIELLVTIALLALLTTITVSVIGNVREKNNVNLYYDLLKNIKSAAKMYVTDNRYKLSGEKTSITLNDLVGDNYLTSPITNPITKEVIDLDNSDVNINITFNSDTKDYSYNISGDICKYYEENKDNRQNDLCAP